MYCVMADPFLGGGRSATLTLSTNEVRRRYDTFSEISGTFHGCQLSGRRGDRPPGFGAPAGAVRSFMYGGREHVANDPFWSVVHREHPDIDLIVFDGPSPLDPPEQGAEQAISLERARLIERGVDDVYASILHLLPANLPEPTRTWRGAAGGHAYVAEKALRESGGEAGLELLRQLARHLHDRGWAVEASGDEQSPHLMATNGWVRPRRTKRAGRHPTHDRGPRRRGRTRRSEVAGRGGWSMSAVEANYTTLSAASAVWDGAADRLDGAWRRLHSTSGSPMDGGVAQALETFRERWVDEVRGLPPRPSPTLTASAMPSRPTRRSMTPPTNGCERSSRSTTATAPWTPSAGPPSVLPTPAPGEFPTPPSGSEPPAPPSPSPGPAPTPTPTP